MMNPSEFEKKLLSENLIIPGDKILIACSGGPDSVALLHLLAGLKKKWKLKIGVVHFNHRLRGRESFRDAQFVRRLAKNTGLRFFEGAAPVKKLRDSQPLSIEEAARKLRYDFFCKTARHSSFPKVATAHTLNDQAETVLMRMVQGTGLRGLCGIRPRTFMEKVVFVRPFLSFSKKEIQDFLKVNRISSRHDSSNDSLRFVRNKIRREILPMLERELNPRAIEALSRIPAIVRAESETLDILEAGAWKRALKKGPGKDRKVDFHRREILGLPETLQFRIIEKALKALDSASGMSFSAWQRVRACLLRGRGRHSLPKDIDFSLTRRHAVVYKKFHPGKAK